jgi:hypothetical protein
MGSVRNFAFLGLLAILIGGCGGGSVTLTPLGGRTPSPTASPSPTPSPVPTTYVAVPQDNNSIQTDLISTIPTGIFTAQNSLATTFSIPASPATCGYTGTGACNFYDGFGFSGAGKTLTLNVSIPNIGHVYTLMNAYAPSTMQLATIQFVGSAGATVTFPLIGGEDIRDFLMGNFVNTLSNGIPNVMALNAYTCVDPTSCMGAASTGNVTTGTPGTYVVDEQVFTLPAAFATQSLVQIVLTDTQNGSNPILLGITTGP